jgi:hypothetical protein
MKKTLLIVAVLLCAHLSLAQAVAVVDYMKVPESGGDAYINIEKQWKRFHQARVNEGKLQSWGLYYIHGTGSASAYNYATVNIYPNLTAALSATYTEADMKKIFGDKYADVIKKTYATRSLTSSTTFNFEMGLDNNNVPLKFLVINLMKTDDMGAYLSMEKDAFLPMHKELMASGQLHSWSIWTRMFSTDDTYDAVAVNGFVSAEQLAKLNYESVLDKLKSSNDGAKVLGMFTAFANTEKIRTQVRTEIWEFLDGTNPPKT